MLSLFKSCGICKIAIPPGFNTRYNLHIWYHLECVQNVVAQNHIVLIVFKGKLQISALHPQVAKTNQ
jgi:hypothetical protein